MGLNKLIKRKLAQSNLNFNRKQLKDERSKISKQKEILKKTQNLLTKKNLTKADVKLLKKDIEWIKFRIKGSENLEAKFKKWVREFEDKVKNLK